MLHIHTIVNKQPNQNLEIPSTSRFALDIGKSWPPTNFAFLQDGKTQPWSRKKMYAYNNVYVRSNDMITYVAHIPIPNQKKKQWSEIQNQVLIIIETNKHYPPWN